LCSECTQFIRQSHSNKLPATQKCGFKFLVRKQVLECDTAA
jgi:hypothetical protein